MYDVHGPEIGQDAPQLVYAGKIVRDSVDCGTLVANRVNAEDLMTALDQPPETASEAR